MSPPSALWRLYCHAVSKTSAAPRKAALIFLVALLPAALLTLQFFSNLQAGFKELLPEKTASVQALSELHTLLGGQSRLTLIAMSPDGKVNRSFVSALCQRLRSRRIPQARSLLCDLHAERQWISHHLALLLPAQTFDALMEDLEQAVHKAAAAANPLYVDLEEGQTPGQQLARLEKRLAAEASTRDRFPRGYLETADGKMVVAVVVLQGPEVEYEPSASLLAAVQKEVAALRPQFPPNLQVAYQGEVASMLEEHDAILADLALSSLLVFLLVGGLLWTYFRSLRGIAAVLFSLLPGLLFTFAIGRLTVGVLNSNTAFLGSIIAGNGINYPLLLLAYYRARPLSEPRAVAITQAASDALAGTLAAAVTASAAYGGLAVSTFRGFSQFGWLGGVGMITTWVLTFITMPIAIALFDPPRHGPRPTTAQRRLHDYFARPYLPYLVAILVIAGTLVFAAFGVQKARRFGVYEMDMQTLRNRDSLLAGSASFDKRVSELFGVWLNPVAAVVAEPALREAAAQELRRVLIQGDQPLVERVETLADYLPTRADQEKRLQRLRRFADSVAKLPRAQLPESALPYLDDWLSPPNLQLLSESAAPSVLTQPFRELSGRTDRVILIYPSLQRNYNDGRNITRFASTLATAALPRGTIVGGSFLLMAELIAVLQREAPRVVVTVCLLVALVLLPSFRHQPLRIPLVVLTVGAVALLAQLFMLAVGVQLNVLNFAALPITIGVGADYAVNLLGAMDAFSVDARKACARMGGAILVCSLTTVVGYLSLLLAQSGALRTFGWAAVLGEGLAVLVVLVVLPTFLPSKNAGNRG